MARRIPAALLATALAAGCADLQWSKPGSNATALTEDLQQCESVSRLQAAREALPRQVSTPIIMTDPAGRPFVAQRNPLDTERFLLEQDLKRGCMRKKGYELVPAQKTVAG